MWRILLVHYRSLFLHCYVFPFWAQNTDLLREPLLVVVGLLQEKKKLYNFNVLRREGLICLLTLFHSQECSMSDFPCSLTRKCNHGYGMENLAFHSLLRWKVIDTANSHSSNISLNWLGECNLNWSTKKGGRPISAIVDLEAFDSEMVVCVGVMIRNCLSCQHWNSR